MKFASTHRRGALIRTGCAVALGATALASTAVIGSTAAHATVTQPSTIILGVGSDQSQRIVSWYGTDSTQALQIEAGTVIDAKARTIAAASVLNGVGDTTSYNAHATITGLVPNTTYAYHVGDSSTWSPTYTFKTHSFSGDFTFDFFGDPQIGSSGHVDDDAAGWASTLNYAVAQDPNTELLVSGGDQVESANVEPQWTAFAGEDSAATVTSDVLKQYPWAATIGNHDVGGKAYEQHFLVPNWSNYDALYTNTSTASGGDYWYIYKDVLFIDLNSNAYAGGADAEHVAYVTDVINNHGAGAKWTVLVYHHSIYSPADHANDADNAQRRTDFTTAFSNLGVDLVLQGHDHSYSRSYSIKNGAKANVSEQPAAPEVIPGPGGVIYVTANSASGSKYYDLTAPTGAAGYGADPLDPTGKRHFANSVENQEHVRTYIHVGVTNDKLDVKTIRAGDCGDLSTNSAVKNGTVGQKWCGTAANTFTPGSTTPNNTQIGGAIGSLVDHFRLGPLGVLASSTPKIAGAAKVGKTLKAIAGKWTAGTALTYRWYANGKPLNKATKVTYKLPASTKGKKITVKVTGKLTGYNTLTKTSKPTAAVKKK